MSTFLGALRLAISAILRNKTRAFLEWDLWAVDDAAMAAMMVKKRRPAGVLVSMVSAIEMRSAWCSRK